MIRLRLSVLKNEPLAQLDLVFHQKTDRRPRRKWITALITTIWHGILKQSKFLFRSPNPIENLILMIENAAAATMKPQHLARQLLAGDWIAIDARLVFFREPRSSEPILPQDTVPYFRNLMQILQRKSRPVWLVFPDDGALPNLPETGWMPVHARDLHRQIKTIPPQKGTNLFLSRPPLEYLFQMNPEAANAIIFNDPIQLRAVLADFPVNDHVREPFERIIAENLLDGFETVTTETIRGFLLAGPPALFLLLELTRIAREIPNIHFLFFGDAALPIFNLFARYVDPKRAAYAPDSNTEPFPPIRAETAVVRIPLETDCPISPATINSDHAPSAGQNLVQCERYCGLLVRSARYAESDYANYICGIEMFISGFRHILDNLETVISPADKTIWLDSIEQYLTELQSGAI